MGLRACSTRALRLEGAQAFRLFLAGGLQRQAGGKQRRLDQCRELLAVRSPHYGLLVRLDRESAARYSFLMSIPVIGGAAAFKGLEVARDGLPAGTAMPFVVGMVAAALSGIAAIWFTLAYLKRHNFNLFVLYRIVVGVAVLVLIAAGVRSGMGI